MCIYIYIFLASICISSELGSNIYTSNGGVQPKYELPGMEIRWFYEELRNLKNI